MNAFTKKSELDPKFLKSLRADYQRSREATRRVEEGITYSHAVFSLSQMAKQGNNFARKKGPKNV
jgi:hypothetical protein